MKWFTRDLSCVEQRTSETRQAIAELQTRQAEIALEAAMSGSYHECDLIAAQLRQANEKLKVLILAEEAVQAQEQAAENEAKAKEQAARRRSLAQHLSRLQRASADFESHVAGMCRSWQVITETASAAQAQCDRPIPELEQRNLFNLAEREIARQGRVPSHLGSYPAAPGSGAALLGGVGHHELEPLSKAIARISRWTNERIAVTGPKPPVKAKAATAAEAPASLVPTNAPQALEEATGAATPAPDAKDAPSRLAALAADPAEAAAFRRFEALKNPHAAGTEEHSGFQAALAEMQGKARHNSQGDRE